MDHSTFVICGDGCLQEGVTSEASSLAGHLGLGKLVVLYDDNNITIDGSTDLSFTEDVGKRYESYGWQVLTVTDLSTLEPLRSAISQAKANKDQPTLIKVKTIIGLGSKKQGTAGVHGAPLGAEDLGNVKRHYGFDPEKSFDISPSVSGFYQSCAASGETAKVEWDTLLAKYASSHPSLHSEFVRRSAGKLPDGLFDLLPTFKEGDKDMASRKLSQACIGSIAEAMPELMGGETDVYSSLPASKESYMWHERPIELFAVCLASLDFASS